MTRTPLWTHILLACTIALLAGFVDLFSDEVFVPVAILVIGAGAVGYFEPRFAWLWAIITGLGIIATHAIARLIGFHSAYAVEPNIFGALIALIPAFVGAYAGAAFRYIVNEE